MLYLCLMSFIISANASAGTERCPYLTRFWPEAAIYVAGCHCFVSNVRSVPVIEHIYTFHLLARCNLILTHSVLISLYVN